MDRKALIVSGKATLQIHFVPESRTPRISTDAARSTIHYLLSTVLPMWPDSTETQELMLGAGRGEPGGGQRVARPAS